MNEGLQAKSEEFASHLTTLIQGCITDAPEFGVVETNEVRQLHIGPLPFSPEGSGFSPIPLTRACDSGQSRLMLKIEFRVSLDDESEFLAVQHSTYGLWVRPVPRRKPRPVFRVEYDRDARSKPPAHVHLHAESLEFGWIYGTADLPPPRLFEIHFPVGGRRFRPTVESRGVPAVSGSREAISGLAEWMRHDRRGVPRRLGAEPGSGHGPPTYRSRGRPASEHGLRSHRPATTRHR